MDPKTAAAISHRTQDWDTSSADAPPHAFINPSPTPRLEYICQPFPPSHWVSPETVPPRSLAGYWTGAYTDDNGQKSDDFGSFLIDSTISGAYEISGFGADAKGDFHLWGNIDGQRITFVKEFGSLLGGWDTHIRYDGLVNETLEEMTGVWGPIDSEDTSCGGMFVFKRRRGYHLSLHHLNEGLSIPKVRLLWNMARDAVLCVVRHRLLRWRTLQERSDKRTIYTLLLLERRESNDQLPPGKDALWRSIVRSNTLEDLRLWRALGEYHARRGYIYHE